MHLPGIKFNGLVFHFLFSDIHALPRGIFYFVYFILTILLSIATLNGLLPIDYRTYHKAAEAVSRGESPYGTPKETRATWRHMHRSGERLEEQATSINESKRDIKPVPGPYLYPPTLALILADAGTTSMDPEGSGSAVIQPAELGAIVLLLFLLVGVIAFGELWLHTNHLAASQHNHSVPSIWWLVLVAASWDVIASFAGANIELLLVGLSLASTYLLWRNKGLWAAPLVAFVLLIKPFFALLFGAFAILTIGTRMYKGWDSIRPFFTTAVLALVLIGLEIARWPSWLRTDFFAYLQNAMAHQWMSLPVALQTPMSAWNRSPLQVMVTWGIRPANAKWFALLLWCVLLGITLWRFWDKKLSFPLVFGGAYLLFFLGRPVSWTLPYLSIVLLLAVRPYMRSKLEWGVVGGGLGLWMLSHWFALFGTLSGAGPYVLTLQSASFPWEILIVLPTAWWVIFKASGRAGRSAQP